MRDAVLRVLDEHDEQSHAASGSARVGRVPRRAHQRDEPLEADADVRGAATGRLLRAILLRRDLRRGSLRASHRQRLALRAARAPPLCAPLCALRAALSSAALYELLPPSARRPPVFTNARNRLHFERNASPTNRARNCIRQPVTRRLPVRTLRTSRASHCARDPFSIGSSVNLEFCFLRICSQFTI